MTSQVSGSSKLELVIAIDGPSGSGKSSTARGVALRLGLDYLDTGSMYRAFTIAATDRGVAADDQAAVADLIASLRLEITARPDGFAVLVDGEDRSAELHLPKVSGRVSHYAKLQPVREFLTASMRQIVANSGRIVVEGRDITTVVCPDAQVRVLLVADPEARISRRESQLAGAADHKTVTEQIVGRDKIDQTVNDLENAADGVVTIDSTHLSLDEVVQEVIDLVPAELR